VLGSRRGTETTTKRSPAHQRGVPATRATAAVDRTTVPDQVRKSLEAGRPAIEALRKLVDTVDGTLPITARGPSRRQEILDSAMEMADRLVDT